MNIDHLFISVVQVTYSIPYAMVSSRIEPLGLGQGKYMIFFFCLFSLYIALFFLT